MLSKEEYKKKLVRMWDSVRRYNSPYKGDNKCNGVNCEKCPIYAHCCDAYQDDIRVYNAFEIIDAVEKWSKEHPVITNRDKFKEIFGWEIPKSLRDCYAVQYCDCLESNDCSECPYNGFWGKEYKEPKEKKEN